MKKRWIKFLLQQIVLPLIFTVSLSQYSHAQSPLVTEKRSLKEYVIESLVGKGVKVSNISYVGDPVAMSAFSNGSQTNIGIDKGLLITTGIAYDSAGIGPQGPNSLGNATEDNKGINNPFLDKLIGNGVSTFDAATLEFDFIPSGDTIRMKYVFASEEFPEFVCSNYNDIFGFFITGPDPFGGEYSDSNFAKIPGKDLPVAINSVNNGKEGQHSGGKKFCYNGEGLTNTHLFVDNCNGCNDPTSTIQYDGFSIPMEIVIPVECSKKYRFKIMIADVGDHQFDSGVFLEAQSFSGNISDPVVDALGTTICAGQSTTLKAIAPGGPYYWFKKQEGGTPIFIGDNLVTDVLYKDTTFYVERIDKGCLSHRIEVKVVVNDGPEVKITDQVECGVIFDLTKGVFTPESNVSFHVSLGDAEKDINPINNPSGVGSGIYYVRVESSSSCVTIKAIEAISVTKPDLATTNLAGCEPLTQLDLTRGVKTNGTVVYFYLSLSDAQNDINRVINPTNSAPGKYYVRSELTGGCFEIDSLDAIINKAPIINITDQYVCFPKDKIDLTKGYNGNGDIVTVHPSILEAETKTGAIHDPDNVLQGTYYIRSEFAATGCYTILPIVASIEPEPTIKVTDQLKCKPAISFDLTKGVENVGTNTIAFYSLLNDAENEVNALLNPNAVLPGSYYVKAKSLKGCSTIQPIKAEEKDLPAIATSDLHNCTPNNVFDLNNGVVSNSNSILFFTSVEDAKNNINPFPDPLSAPSGKYFVRTESANDCFIVDSLEAIVNPSPTLSVENIERCEPVTSFNLGDGIIETNGLNLAYYISNQDAEDQVNEILTPENVVSGKYYVRSNSANSCFTIDSLEAIKNFKPILSTTNLVMCFPQTSSNLSDGVVTTAFSVTYHLSLQDAKNGSNPITNTTDVSVGKYYVNASSDKNCSTVDSLEIREAKSELWVVDQEVCAPAQTIDLTNGVIGNGLISFHYSLDEAEAGVNPVGNPKEVSEGLYFVRNFSGGCISIKSINAKINPIPNLELEDRWTCEPNLVDLTLGTNGLPYDLTFYEKVIDAKNKVNPIKNPKALNEGIYYVRGEYSTGCFSIDTLKASIFPLPELTTEDQHVCKPEKVNLMFGLYSNGSATFHYTFSDAEKGSNPIEEPTAVDEGLYHVRSVSDVGCVDTDSIRAFIDDIPALEIENQQACDPNLVDLTQGVTTSTIQNSVLYFGSLQEALKNENPLTNPQKANSGKYFVRVESIYGCSTIGEIEAFINKAPEPPVVKDALICSNSKAYLSIENPSGLYNWYSSDNPGLVLSTSYTFITPILPTNKTYLVEKINEYTDCKSDFKRVNVVVTDTLPGPTVLTPAICEGDSGSVYAIGPNGPYSWFKNMTDETPFFVGDKLHFAHPNSDMTYYVEIVNNSSCPSKRTIVKPKVVSVPEAKFSVDQDHSSPNKVTLLDLSNGGTTGTWVLDENTKYDYLFGGQSLSHSYAVTENNIKNHVITLIISNEFNCKDTAIEQIQISSFWNINFPNAFTPNNDNLNDRFYGVGFGIESFELNVFNRWGELVFKSNSLNEQWDGRAQHGNGRILPSGMYVWKVKIKDLYKENHVLTGHVLLQK